MRITQNMLADPARNTSEDTANQNSLNKAKSSIHAWQRVLDMHALRASDNLAINKLVSPTDFYDKVSCKKETKKFDRFNPGDMAGVENADCQGSVCSVDQVCDLSAQTTTGDGKNAIFFAGGGTTFELETKYGSAFVDSEVQVYAMSQETKTGAELELSIFGVYSETAFAGSTAVTHKWGSESKSESEETSTVKFVLGDPDLGDQFDVQYFFDKQFRTPYFKAISGKSQCPHEPGTVPREKWVLEMPKQMIEGVDPGQPAIFKAFIRNESPTDDTNTCYLRTALRSNSKGLQIKLNGFSLVQPVMFYDIPANQATEVTLEARRSFTDYVFDDVLLELVSDCEWDLYDGFGLWRDPLMDSKNISVHFEQPCSAVEWSGDRAESTSFNIMQLDENFTLTVRNPYYLTDSWTTNDRLQTVKAQYRRQGDVDWVNAQQPNGQPATLTEGTSGYSQVTIKPPLTDEVYEMRVMTYCDGQAGWLGSRATDPVVVTVDRVAPVMFGRFAQPADGIWW